MSLLFSSELNIYSIKIYKIMKTLQCSVLVKGPHQIFAAELAGAVADEGAAGDDAVHSESYRTTQPVWPLTCSRASPGR